MGVSVISGNTEINRFWGTLLRFHGEKGLERWTGFARRWHHTIPNLFSAAGGRSRGKANYQEW